MILIDNPNVRPGEAATTVHDNRDHVLKAVGDTSKLHYIGGPSGIVEVSPTGGGGSGQGYPSDRLGGPRRHRDRYGRRDQDSSAPNQYPRFGKIASQLFMSAHQAFDAHVPLALTPEVIWYAIVHEVSVHAKMDPQRYERLLTNTPGTKAEILIRRDELVYGSPSNDWGAVIGDFRNPLMEAMPAGSLEIFLPSFTTTGPAEETVILLGLMDTVSEYFSYTVSTRCGIPQIRLEGEVEDWRKLRVHADGLRGLFDGLGEYFAVLDPILAEFENATGGSPDACFWNSLYKYEGPRGSGGPKITGWLASFLAHTPNKYDRTGNEPFRVRRSTDWSDGHNGISPDGTPMHVTTVDFKWDYLGTDIPMTFAGGITASEMDEGFIRPRLGFAVAEPEKRD